ncbi:hypothetical protein PPL_05824 [Heterostelium album PN500]|uniref:Uncharacterized protein n=1 Tax=Heterostelium pallidum (strain ATCC 26659 / Pp 5 / PN500) TaxID=670386 RepID=D3BBF6_HETP5|nr:hypothetical protein PPL_05824 [Heterostelium album PN500]EFA80989.1 hypothetical protein PPL_05824 [Heterostelium album PN500]|eukprot:XP_020433107.1 hypothetical protein PPL_05824 [Heterostelium album PN500]
MVFVFRLFINYSKLTIELLNEETKGKITMGAKGTTEPIVYSGVGGSVGMKVPLKATGKTMKFTLGNIVHNIVDDDYKLLLDGEPILNYVSDPEAECCLVITGGDNPEFMSVQILN